MTITIDSVSLQPIGAPIAPHAARQPQVAAVGERDSANNERRESARNDRGRASVAFRSFLNAATLAGLTQSLSADTVTASTDEAPAKAPRAEKIRDQQDPTVIDADEAEGLYRSAQAASEPQSARAKEYLAATSRYATSYFAVSGTFARPGETLELTA